MNERSLTEKEWLVLKYFIEYESMAMQGIIVYKKNPIILECKDGDKHFLAYPSMVAKDFESKYKRISKKWAIKICEEFHEEGLLDYEMIKAPRQKNPTEHYFLKSGFDASKKIGILVIENAPDWESRQLLSQMYFQKNFTESTIRKVLSEKKVETRRSIDIWDWEPSEAKLLFNNISNNQYSNFEEYILRMFKWKYDHEKETSSFGTTFSFRLPVLEQNNPKTESLLDDQIEYLKSINKRTFEENSLLGRNTSALNDHYKRIQRNQWIVPLMALIKASPKALAEFLYGDWEVKGSEDSSYYVFSREGMNSFKYPFFRILFTAISDIALTRNVENNEVNYAEFRSSSSHHSSNSNYLLRIVMQSGLNIYFDGGFDTNHAAIGDEAGNVYEFPDETYYWAKAWFDFPTGPWQTTFLKIEDVIDFNLFVDELTKSKNLMGKFLFDHVANYMKNILLSCPNLNDAPDGFKNDLLFEINNFIFSLDFSSEFGHELLVLSEFAKSEIEKLKEIEKRALSFDAKFLSWKTQQVNRLILEDMFPDAIRKNYDRVKEEEAEHNV